MAYDPEIAAKIKAARVAAKMTQAELADRLGVHTVTVSRWEGGAPGQMPEWPLLRRLAEVLGVGLIDLIPEGR